MGRRCRRRRCHRGRCGVNPAGWWAGRGRRARGRRPRSSAEADGQGGTAVVLEAGRVETGGRVGEVVVGRGEAAGPVVVEVGAQIGQGVLAAVARPDAVGHDGGPDVHGALVVDAGAGVSAPRRAATGDAVAGEGGVGDGGHRRRQRGGVGGVGLAVEEAPAVGRTVHLAAGVGLVVGHGQVMEGEDAARLVVDAAAPGTAGRGTAVVGRGSPRRCWRRRGGGAPVVETAAGSTAQLATQPESAALPDRVLSVRVSVPRADSRYHYRRRHSRPRNRRWRRRPTQCCR